MDANTYDFSSPDALLDFGGLTNSDPRSHLYPSFLQSSHHPPSNPTWPPLGLEGIDESIMSQHHNHHQHHHQQQQQHLPQQQQQQQQQHQQSSPPPQQQQQHQQTSSPSHSHQHSPQIYGHTAASHQTQDGNSLAQQSGRTGSDHGISTVNLQSSALGVGYDHMLPANWQFQLQQAAQLQQFGVPTSSAMQMNNFAAPSYGGQLQASPVDFMPVTTADNFAAAAAAAAVMSNNNFMAMGAPIDPMNSLVFPLNDYHNDLRFSINMANAAVPHQTPESVHSRSSIPGNSPTGTILEVQSVSDNEGSWSIVNYNSNRQSIDSFTGTVSNPGQNLHIRTTSHSSSSDEPNSAELSGSFEEISPWHLGSPVGLHDQDYLEALHQSHHLAASTSMVVASSSHSAQSYRSSGSSSTSPTSSGPTSPPLRRRKSPLETKTTKPVIIKKTNRKDASTTEKKVGRRKGPLRPDQRQQAHEIRKLRACLRCKFLKKTCDKGEPCGGCRPSHARLWQVPCTRMDIKDLAYFMKDWKADFERHVTMGFSVGNIKGFGEYERTLYITHGYGHYLPINAREVFVRDDQCFGLDWVETTRSENPEEYEVDTAKLSAGVEGVSASLLSEYLDRHLEGNYFEDFVDNLFEGTKFLTEMLKTAYRYYCKSQTDSIRKALKLVLAYNLTQHVTLVEGLSEEEAFTGKIEDERSRFNGKTVAPVMINFQVKCALADMWRELQKNILEELSTLYSSVYSGEKLKNWPTIFMLAAILLAIWEEMQFDCHYRVPDEAAVNKFCEDMETTPVGVIVGLFQAISTKLPGLQDWDTKQHHQLLGSNPAVCDALTEVKQHVNKYESYLKDRSSARFDREDFDSLSNKFLSRLVIRAN